MKELLRVLLVSAMAIFGAHCTTDCVPPGGEVLEQAYKSEIVACVNNAKTKSESCFCRKAVDEHYGLCDHPEWPRMGRCDAMCEGVR